MLHQKAPEAHRVDKGDVLGVYIGGITGDEMQPPPVRLPDQTNQIPSMGYPVVVGEAATGTTDLSRTTGEAAGAAKEIADNITGFHRATQENSEGARQVNAFAGELKQVAAALQRLVGQFNTGKA